MNTIALLYKCTRFIIFSLLRVFLAATANAQSVSGTVNVTITLTDSCLINGALPSGSVNFGNLTFGSHPTMFTNATGQIQNGGGSITLQCNAATAPTLNVNDAQATGGRIHAMTNGTGKYVAYDLYTDAGHTAVINNGATFYTSTNNNTVENVNVYGQAFGASGLTPGNYNDVITLELAF